VDVLPVGVKAVYASANEETAMREVTVRKRALGGRKQIAIADYPRMTYVLSVTTQRNLSLAGRLPPELAAVVGQCLHSASFSPSQDLASIWIANSIESVIFPSATGSGNNIVIYLANFGRRSVVVRNRAEVLAALRRHVSAGISLDKISH
jgi:RES domain-containing protein